MRQCRQLMVLVNCSRDCEQQPSMDDEQKYIQSALLEESQRLFHHPQRVLQPLSLLSWSSVQTNRVVRSLSLEDNLKYNSSFDLLKQKTLSCFSLLMCDKERKNLS